MHTRHLEASHSQARLKLAVTRHEAAHLLGISMPTLDRLVVQGLLRPSRATRRPLFAIRELERFLAETTDELV